MTERIKPFYDVPTDVETTTLFELANATISQGDKTCGGRLEIVQNWEPMGTRIDFWFDTEQPDEFRFGDAKITASELRAPITLDIALIASDAVRGSITEPVDIGTDFPLDRVTFHVPNFSDFMTADSHAEFSKDGKRSVDQWCQVILEHDGWRITIQSRPPLDWRIRNMAGNRPVRFTAFN